MKMMILYWWNFSEISILPCMLSRFRNCQIHHSLFLWFTTDTNDLMRPLRKEQFAATKLVSNPSKSYADVLSAYVINHSLYGHVRVGLWKFITAIHIEFWPSEGEWRRKPLKRTMLMLACWLFPQMLTCRYELSYISHMWIIVCTNIVIQHIS